MDLELAHDITPVWKFTVGQEDQMNSALASKALHSFTHTRGYWELPEEFCQEDDSDVFLFIVVEGTSLKTKTECLTYNNIKSIPMTCGPNSTYSFSIKICS